MERGTQAVATSRPQIAKGLCHSTEAFRFLCFSPFRTYFTTLTKIIRKVNRTSDSMKASPTNRAI